MELPVNETKGIRVSRAIAWPISAPPQNDVNIAPGKLFLSKTPATISLIAIVINGVVGAPFLQESGNATILNTYEYMTLYKVRHLCSKPTDDPQMCDGTYQTSSQIPARESD